MKKQTITRMMVLSVIVILLLANFSACSLRMTVYSFPNLIDDSERESAPKRPMNDNSVSTERFTIERDDMDSVRMQLAELLYITSQKRARPIFTAEVWADVRESYHQAVNVLDRYIKNEWHDGAHDFEKVLAIHDYLASEIAYDHALYRRSLVEELTDEDVRAFEITGVFLEKKAVCDGLSKAFVLMCAIEGIEARYIRGSYTDTTGSSLHAWNKVKLDGVWYNVDVTLDNFLFDVDGKPYNVLHHGYFLRSDRMMYGSGGHIEEAYENSFSQALLYPPVPASGEFDYDYYEGRTVPGLADVSMTVNSESELKAVFSGVKKSRNPRIGAVELQLDFTGGGEASNDISDYAQAIATAYQAAGLSSLSYSVGMSNPPFVQFPGGIFLFLIYV